VSDIFVSYAREDRQTAASLASHLEALGWTVWWDRQILAGKEFDRVIEREIGQACCVLVIWSAHSVESRWVKTEASEGLRRDILVPIIVGECEPPLAFRNIQSVAFADTVFEPGSPAFDDLIASITPLVKPRSIPHPAAAAAAETAAPLAVVHAAPQPFAQPAALHHAPHERADSAGETQPWYRRPAALAGVVFAAVVLIASIAYVVTNGNHPASGGDQLPAQDANAARMAPAAGPVARPDAETDAAFSEPRIRSFVEEFLAAQGSADAEKLLPFYGDRVDYYGSGSVDQDFIRRDKSAYFRRWPILQYVLRGEIYVRDMPTPDAKTVTFTTGYEVHSPQRNDDARGMNQTTLVVANVNGALKIVDHKERAVSARE
jgi:hypothetical protein